MVGLENWIFRKSFSVDRKIVALTTEIHFRSYFHFKWFPELGTRKGRTRERKNARSSGAILHEASFAPIAIDASRDRVVNRNPRSHRQSWSEIALLIARSRRVLLGLSRFFWVLPLPSSFPTSFPNTRKYFSKNILKCTKHMKTFSFPENGIFFGNAFTRTKHNLSTVSKFLHIYI